MTPPDLREILAEQKRETLVVEIVRAVLASIREPRGEVIEQRLPCGIPGVTDDVNRNSR